MVHMLEHPREEGRCRILAGNIIISFAWKEGKVFLAGRRRNSQVCWSMDDLWVPPVIYKEAERMAYAAFREIKTGTSKS